jgi:hypothetical protein
MLGVDSGVDAGYMPTPSSQLPVIPNLPSLTKSFDKKYTDNAAVLNQLDPATLEALKRIDLLRVQKGQAPLSKKQTAFAVTSVTQNAPVTETPGPDLWNVWGNTTKDIGTVLKSIYKLPMAIVNEVKALPTIPTEFAKNQAEGMNPLAAILKAPGIRMIPGSYIAGNIANGPQGFSELAAHPGFTALDVLPFAKQLAGLTPAVRAAEAASTAADVVKVNPIRTALTRKVASPELFAVTNEVLTPNRLGQFTKNIAENTKTGGLLSEAFGALSRESAGMVSRKNLEFREAINTEAPMPKADPFNVIRNLRDSQQLAKTFNVSQERMVALTAEMQAPAVPNWETLLPANEQAMVSKIREITGEYASHGQDLGDLVQVGGEWYDAAKGNRLSRMQELLDRRSIKMQNLLPKLQAAAAADPKVALFVQQIENALDPTNAGKFVDAYKTYNSLMRGKTRLGGPSQVGQTVAPSANITLSQVTNVRKALRDVTAVEKRLGQIDSSVSALPARFQPLVEKVTRERVTAELINRGGDGELISRNMMTRNYGAIPGWDSKLFNNTTRDVAKTWGDLRAQGFDPVYIHRVAPNAEASLLNPTVQPFKTAISQVKERALNSAPHIGDAQIGLTHQGYELLRRTMSEEVAGQVIEHFGERQGDLFSKAFKIAEIEAINNGKFPGLTAQNIGQSAEAGNFINMRADQIVRQSHTPFNPEMGAGYARGKVVGDLGNENIWVPKTVAKTFNRMQKEGANRLTAPFDPALKLFRTSVLSFSPRWHFYNVLGGATMLMAQTNPFTVWKYLSEAREIMKNNFEALPAELRGSMGSASKLESSFQYGMGSAYKRILESYPEGVQNVGGKIGGAASKARDAVEALSNKSFKLNAMVDDMYRTMSYLFGKDKSLGQGLSASQAEAIGMQYAKKTLQSWDSLTPIERSVARQVMPFYGFMQHIMRFTFKYPFDHPLRTSILSNFAQNEMDDRQNGLSDAISGMIPLGGKDAQGNQRYLSTRGINPFEGVSNYFTLQGLAGQLNPLISGTLQTLGLDTQSGEQSLYPNMYYDKETGRLRPSNGNLLSNIGFGVLPQARLIQELAGGNAEYNALMRVNPAAAMRLMTGQVGLPVVTMTKNIPEEQMKQELKRQEAQALAKSEYLKTGDRDAVKGFPQLKPFVDAVERLKQTGAIRNYQPAGQQSPTFGRGAIGVLNPIKQ